MVNAGGKYYLYSMYNNSPQSNDNGIKNKLKDVSAKDVMAKGHNLITNILSDNKVYPN